MVKSSTETEKVSLGSARITQVRDIPVVAEYDVVVCGGGPSGFIAAIAAARGGARVALIERLGFLGGMATASLVAPISVFNYNDRRIIDGIPWEFIERLIAIGGAREEKPIGNITFSPEKYKLIAQRMVLEAGVSLYLHSYLTGCKKDGDRITHVFIDNKNGAEAIAGKYFIDCTGDADLSKLSGVPMQPMRSELQPASLIFMLGGVDVESLPMVRHSMQGVNYHDLDMRNILEEMNRHQDIPRFGGPWYCGVLDHGMVLVNMTRTYANMADNRQATHTECALREDVFTFVELLTQHVPAFKDAYLVMTAPQTGTRETRRIKGVHTLTGEEYINAQDFPDAISRGCHPVDIHSSVSNNQRCEFLKDAAFVPYRCLIAPDFPNLLVGGRAFSADGVSSASVRVQASVMGLGQAAGVAAALCYKTGVDVSHVDITELRNTLIRYGANLK
ncbi:FAD-dependent oxidoreductase [Sphingobacterium faecale]|uniref:FAD-dependent oxidoreductase n=1 Tax=Sphingobacterium faecale TaxID=2803775 RepID=A0ABS1R252_9SPHI|nr:FAD-dependent oxidoreductase [Sphingobacterium faecale]MBL1408723.1 FAD-dependent oxidoreductase [Sphingobacterium faecale]